ncbi:MAG: hypothetical protein JNK15_02725 [Planctomycetes bacterium]|nr:hypothetical protein [Planctomycetota bacterium]
MRGSWPTLVLVGVAFLLAFAAMAGWSGLLALERDRAATAALAKRHGLGVADVEAVRWALGPDGQERTAAALAAFAAAKAELGAPLAAVAVFGDPAVARAARARAADAELAWAAFQTEPAALPGHLFLQVRERFAVRAAARD